MTETHFFVLLGIGVAVLVLQAVLLFRRPRFDTPADLNARLGLLEQASHDLLRSVAQSEAGIARMERQLHSFTELTSNAMAAGQDALDDKLDRTVAEARYGRTELTTAFSAFETRLEQRLGSVDATLSTRFEVLQNALTGRLDAMAQGAQTSAEQIRATLNDRLGAIQKDNTEKLEQMRRTVDEKLHATLEQRLGDSFKLVSERLEQVHAGLGEMKNLAGSVGDLKRVMTNVRTRGTWGEVQLGAIIESLLTAEQYARNVKTVPGSNDLVEFAVRMPGRSDDAPVWLPLDSKYPVEHYQRLIDAHETADRNVILQAANAFEASIRAEAKKISGKYLSPPHTTDFAILFLPTEGLFAEVARIPGLVEALQNEHRVVVAGPTTLAAMLNSLRLGFRTLAIEKRSSEVWTILGSVKTEFQKFGDIVEATKKSIEAAARKFDEVGVRARAVQRQLRDVQELPSRPAAAPLGASDLLRIDDRVGRPPDEDSASPP